MTQEAVYLDLEKNETAPEPVLPTPRTPTTQEREQAVLISIETKNNVSNRKIILLIFLPHE